MDAIVQMKTAAMLRKLAGGDLQHIGGYPFAPQKKGLYYVEQELSPLPRSTPELQGTDSGAVGGFFRALETYHPHGAMLLRHGKVIAEGYWSPWQKGYSNMVYSLSKSVTGMAVGLAVSEGLLRTDERLVDIFPEKTPRIRAPRIDQITVEHLLTMSSGVHFNESASVLEKDWVRAALESDCAFAPGSRFFYNSINSYLLAAAVCRRACMSLTQYLTPRLFSPMGLSPHWETCPLGIEKGGWGLWLTLEEMAKLGQLMLQSGRWTINGESRQLLPAVWVERMREKKIYTESGICRDGYGYQVWLCPFDGAYQFNGAYGQYVVILPEQDMVIAILSGERNMFATGGVIAEIGRSFAKHSLSDRPLPPGTAALRLARELRTLRAMPGPAVSIPAGSRTGAQAVQRYASPSRFAKVERSVHEKIYDFAPSICGLLPMALQCCRMNFTFGVQSVRIQFHKSSCTIYMREGDDAYALECGLDGADRLSPVSIRGETFQTACAAVWAQDEFSRPKLIVYCRFIETPHTRIMSFLFDRDELHLRFTEWPRAADATKMLVELVAGPGSRLDQLFTSVSQREGIKRRMDRVATPKAFGLLRRRSDRDA